MGGKETKINCPEDNRSVTININGDFRVNGVRPSFDSHGGRCSVPSEPKISISCSHTRRNPGTCSRGWTWSWGWDHPGGLGKNFKSTRRK